jgi:hypothetical protein
MTESWQQVVLGCRVKPGNFGLARRCPVDSRVGGVMGGLCHQCWKHQRGVVPLWSVARHDLL